MSPEGKIGSGEIYVEFVRQGNFVKVTAIDAMSGAEASIVGPASAAQSDLQQLAVKKLKSLKKTGRSSPSERHPPPVTRKGIVV